MQYLIFLAATLILILFPPIAAAQEIQFSTYQELARVVTDMQTGNTSALITLQSGSPNDIILPENRISCAAAIGGNSIRINVAAKKIKYCIMMMKVANNLN